MFLEINDEGEATRKSRMFIAVLPYSRRSVATPMPDGSAGEEEGTFTAAAFAHFRNAITTVDEEPSCRMGR